MNLLEFLNLWSRVARGADTGGGTTAGGADEASTGDTVEGGTNTNADTDADTDDDSTADDSGDGDAAREAVADAPPPIRKPDWRDKRINTLTARVKAAEEALAQQRQQQDASGGANGDGAGDSAAEMLPAAEVNRRADMLAHQRVAAKAFDDACAAVADKGFSVFGKSEFRERVNALGELVDRTDPQSMARYNEFLQQVLESDEPERVIFELGADLDEAERLLTMPTTKRAAAVIKRGLKATRDDNGQDRDVSGGRSAKELPKPIRPVRDRGGRHEEIAPDDPERANKLSMADWMARRQAQVDAKNPRKRAG